MKIKNLMKIFLTQLAIVIFATFAHGQVESGTIFPNGITVAHTTDYGSVNEDNSFSAYGYGANSSRNDLITHQSFINKTNKTYTGYDLQVIPQEDLTKFKVLIKPLSVPPKVKNLNIKEDFKFITLPKYPNEILIDDGDIITLDIFENPKTKEKIIDYVLVTRSKSTGPRFASKYIPKDFTIDDVELSFEKYEIKINDESFFKSGGGGSGGNIALYLPGKGRFIASPFPREGYPFQKIATITNNELTFSYGGEDYKIISNLPILGRGGKWHCWIIFQPNHIQKDIFGNGLASGVIMQSGDIKWIFEN